MTLTFIDNYRANILLLQNSFDGTISLVYLLGGSQRFHRLHYRCAGVIPAVLHYCIRIRSEFLHVPEGVVAFSVEVTANPGRKHHNLFD